MGESEITNKPPATITNETSPTRLQMTINRGSLYLSAEIYERYFSGLTAVILLREQNDLLIMPVMHAASGGYLLKLRNAAGDRVINAMDFIREQRIDDFTELSFVVTWKSDKAALIANNLFDLDN